MELPEVASPATGLQQAATDGKEVVTIGDPLLIPHARGRLVQRWDVLFQKAPFKPSSHPMKLFHLKCCNLSNEAARARLQGVNGLKIEPVVFDTRIAKGPDRKDGGS